MGPGGAGGVERGSRSGSPGREGWLSGLGVEALGPGAGRSPERLGSGAGAWKGEGLGLRRWCAGCRRGGAGGYWTWWGSRREGMRGRRSLGARKGGLRDCGSCASKPERGTGSVAVVRVLRCRSAGDGGSGAEGFGDRGGIRVCGWRGAGEVGEPVAGDPWSRAAVSEGFGIVVWGESPGAGCRVWGPPSRT